jgi:flavoprotein, HI0933 family
MRRVFVIGGGPAGMMAAYAAAMSGSGVTLFEKNEKLGKKLYLTGKGRCNLTNAAPISEFHEHVVQGGLFLYSAFYALDNVALLDLLSRYGLKTKTERGGRVFPESDRASDVTKALEKALKDAGVRISLGTSVQGVVAENGKALGIVAGGGRLECDSVIVATGGLSYPSTGSTGDGYEFAKHAGHTVTPLSASLVGLDTAEDVRELAGLTLKISGCRCCAATKPYTAGRASCCSRIPASRGRSRFPRART